VAFAWDGEKRDNFDIYTKLVGTGAPLRLTSNAAYEDSPAWSPDGGDIAFFRRLPDHDEIWTVPALGGVERKIGESWSGGAVGGAAGGYGGYWWWGQLSWSPDGKFIALPSKNAGETAYSIFLLSVETGEKRKLTSSPNEYISDSAPRFSPDGKTIAFVRGSSPLSSEVYVMNVVGGNPTGEARRLTFHRQEIFGLDWTPDSRRLVYSSGHFGNTSLLTISASGGLPERFGSAGENAIGVSVSRSGNRLVYERDAFDFNIWRVPGPNSSDRKSEPSRFIASTHADMEPQFSPDGTKIAFTSSRSGSDEIWVCDREGHNPVPLTAFAGPPLGSPRWSPDSQWVVFDSPKAGNSDIYLISSERGPPRRLTSGPANHTRPSWSRDGRWIYFGSDRNRNWQQIWKVPSRGGAAVQLRGAKGEEAFESSDGKSVYYAKSNAPGIWRIPVEGGNETRILDQARESLWALTDQGICFFDLGNSAGATLNFYSFAARKLTVLREFSRETRLDTFSTALSVARDGSWILYTQLDQSGSDLMLLDNYR
jgi:Tol biopolymer transport system component